MKDAAKLLRLSYTKAKELFDTRQIYCAETYGRRTILREAVEHYLKGGTALQYVELLVQHARKDARYKEDSAIVEEFAREMRLKWVP